MQRPEMKLGNLKNGKSVFFMCDLQEKFRPVISDFDNILRHAKRLVEVARILDLPLIVSEQYPRGLGKTVPEVEIGHAIKCFEKTEFTMCNTEILELLESLKISHVILFGLETHICIQQTVIDLLQNGFEVHVIADATSSRNDMDRAFALQRFQQCGAFVTTSEAVILQLIGGKDHPKFKEIKTLLNNTFQ